MVVGGEVREHGPVHAGGVGGLVQVDDHPEPDLEPAPLSHRLGQYIVKCPGLVFLRFLNIILTAKQTFTLISPCVSNNVG